MTTRPKAVLNQAFGPSEGDKLLHVTLQKHSTNTALSTMKPTPTLLICLYFFTNYSLAQQNSALFSQYLGAPTVSATFDSPSATLQSEDFAICTNYVHALQAIPTAIATSAVPQLQQQQVDGLCQFCTSLSLSRPDSCCAVPTSVDCFEAFASGGGGAAKTSPTATTATTTAGIAAGTGGAPSPAATSKSGVESIGTVSFGELRRESMAC